MRTVGIGAEKKDIFDMDELKKENKSLKSSNTRLSKKVEELEEKLLEASDYAEKADGKIDELVTSNAELSKKVEELEKK